ncbi:MAG: aminoacyl-tRNA hydrolase [Chlorobiota bacterium]|jgi:PTH1 family peptidyl-tRNA hydrolase|nr:aminoacyl-tRNA hydrolase [Chlorobiota bacterium]QQS67115.1 MAG: aminoacyl-tRNA hydrolase [Chlorobiota bacterium]
MNVIIGLGNPGDKYIKTRHNIGWLVLDEFARQVGAKEYQAGKGDFYFTNASFSNKKILLVKPTTFMNLSGIAVEQILNLYNISTNNILVIADEIQLSLGRIKLSAFGSSGGHNGIQNIVDYLGTTNFPRLKFGIGNDFTRGELAEYVLSEFPPNSIEIVQEMILKSVEAIKLFLVEGTEQAMITVNQKIKVITDFNLNSSNTD